MKTFKELSEELKESTLGSTSHVGKDGKINKRFAKDHPVEVVDKDGVSSPKTMTDDGLKEEKDKLDKVGSEDPDIDNDGDVDKSDKFLAARRKKIGSAIKNEKKKLDERAMPAKEFMNDMRERMIDNMMQNLKKMVEKAPTKGLDYHASRIEREYNSHLNGREIKRLYIERFGNPDVDRSVAPKGRAKKKGGFLSKFGLKTESLEEAFKPGKFELGDNSSVTISKKDAELMNKFFGDLEKGNQKKMESIMKANKKGFKEILTFAKEVQ